MRTFLLFVFALVAVSSFATDDSLASWVRARKPWAHLASMSEQHQPPYFGATPRELVLGLEPESAGALPRSLRAPAEKWARALRRAERVDALELEIWPSLDDEGQMTWTFARQREPGEAWRWISPEAISGPILPEKLDGARAKDHARLFDDFLTLDDLYEKPRFGDCVFTDRDTGEILAAWPAPGEREEKETELGSAVAHCLPQPARLDGKALSLVVKVTAKKVRWPKVRWRERAVSRVKAATRESVVTEWPEAFAEAYGDTLRQLDGESTITLPNGERLRFRKKNSAQESNHLDEVAAFLERHYRKLGLRTFRQRFEWRGIPQSNLIAVIPGTDSSLPPVMLADHYDTAFCEDTFASTGRRVSAPGADDNGTATATLLAAADRLAGVTLHRDLWLVHLTGEEYPADDLGARHLLEDTLRKKRDLGPLVLVDMIGHRKRGDRVFQLSLGEGEGSALAARIALGAANDVAPDLRAEARDRFSRESYLYNTDGFVFWNLGFPVVLVNEHLNATNLDEASDYHQSTDDMDHLDLEYAAKIAKVAIETAARLANE